MGREHRAFPPKPARQGDLDSLCGLYAVVNAVERVGVKASRWGLQRALFRRLVNAVEQDELADVIGYGISPEDLVSVARRSFRWLHRRNQLKLTIRLAFRGKPPPDLNAYLQWLDTVTADPLKAVIINFVMPWTDHWTVVEGRSGPILLLRDSGSRKVLDLRRFRLRGGHYRIRAANTLVVTHSVVADHIEKPMLKPPLGSG